MEAELLDKATQEIEINGRMGVPLAGVFLAVSQLKAQLAALIQTTLPQQLIMVVMEQGGKVPQEATATQVALHKVERMATYIYNGSC